MASTFMGLETAKRGLNAQQSALYITGNNIANANTPGYSRQRVTMSQSETLQMQGYNRVQGIGTGVNTEAVSRQRESFLDNHYRQEANSLGYWQTKSELLTRMEDVMNEPSEHGLSNSMNQFFNSIADLSLYPEDTGVREVALQRGIALADTFNNLHNRLTILQKDIKTSIDHNVRNINQLLSDIHSLNDKIGKIEPSGQLPNDLYDKRDQLTDELAQYINIKVERIPSGGTPHASAAGKYTIKLADKDNQIITDLIDGNIMGMRELAIQYNADQTGVQSIMIKGPHNSETFSVEKYSLSGVFSGQIDAFGKETADSDKAVAGTYPDMLRQLNEMAYTFAGKFNELQKAGWSLEEIKAGGQLASSDYFFDISALSGSTDAAKVIRVHDHLKESSNRIAAAKGNFSGDGSNAVLLAGMKDLLLFEKGFLPDDEGTASLASYYQGVIGKLGVEAAEANRQTTQSSILTDSVQNKRDSVSAVSIDEEMTDLIKYQQAYNSSARMITAVDEMLDRIINGMGLSGR
ncbi:flagellar hook-associated protein FlgK [Jeotgalibacillus sp. S-D1]|uniref:flagellar hook-associated protein FlgK n=1 Tax=Jeotgalibacillus sp. S-D1 TaxID=2552189 RepID=UPI00105941AA|nr:flagellar hook-associated protein FlgK [Jeotgalibacillus sp. S-D1]TDL32586.1 flagellar hook-associated protein FlgK [Jeotgalibacillus sp. S-D1]